MSHKDENLCLIILCSILFQVLLIIVLTNIYYAPSDIEKQLVKQYHDEYAKCITELSRNKDCTLTGFIFTVTTKQD